MRYINPTQIKDTPKETVTLNHEDMVIWQNITNKHKEYTTTCTTSLFKKYEDDYIKTIPLIFVIINYGFQENTEPNFIVRNFKKLCRLVTIFESLKIAFDILMKYEEQKEKR